MERAVENFGKDIVLNDQFLADILRTYGNANIVAFASSELFENLLESREKFLLDLKKTFEELLKAMPAPKFQDNK